MELNKKWCDQLPASPNVCTIYACVCTNMRCVGEKIADWKFLAKQADLDIVAITEECWNDKNQ